MAEQLATQSRVATPFTKGGRVWLHETKWPHLSLKQEGSGNCGQQIVVAAGMCVAPIAFELLNSCAYSHVHSHVIWDFMGRRGQVQSVRTRHRRVPDFYAPFCHLWWQHKPYTSLLHLPVQWRYGSMFSLRSIDRHTLNTTELCTYAQCAAHLCKLLL